MMSLLSILLTISIKMKSSVVFSSVHISIFATYYSSPIIHIMIKLFLPVSFLTFLCLSACSPEKKEQTTSLGAVVQSEKQNFRVDTITAELSNPWGVAFLPDGRILITERGGEIRIVKDGKLLEEKIQGVPSPLYVKGQSGLLDIVLHPDYKTNGWIYLSYSKALADS